MTSKEFLTASQRTDLDLTGYAGAMQRVVSGDTIMLLHAAIGLCTETGELMDALKKHIFYGKDIDRVNLIEEAGDLEWYMALLLRNLSTTHDSVFEINVEKLKKRYPDKFSEFAALNRDLAAERKLLEDATPMHVVIYCTTFIDPVAGECGQVTATVNGGEHGLRINSTNGEDIAKLAQDLAKNITAIYPNAVCSLEWK